MKRDAPHEQNVLKELWMKPWQLHLHDNLDENHGRKASLFCGTVHWVEFVEISPFTFIWGFIGFGVPDI